MPPLKTAGMKAVNRNSSPANKPSAPKPTDTQAGEQRIKIPMAILMVGVALIFDAIQFVLLYFNALLGAGTVIDFVVSSVVTFWASAIFWVWFKWKGVNYFDKNAAKKMLIMFGSFIVELVPLLDAIPAITAGVIALIIQTRIEDTQKTQASTSEVQPKMQEMAA
jgi:hypothetical protein